MSSSRRSFLVALFALVIAAVLYLLFWPVSINPASWTPVPAPQLTDKYQQNSKLSSTERLPVGPSPEDVAIDSQDRIYAGLDDGRIIRLRPDGTGAEVFANTHGRPLGLIFDAGQNLLVADAVKGLLSISPAGQITTLSSSADGVPLGATNDLDVARDGTIYFTDASTKFPMTRFKDDILESQPNGRLLAYDPVTKETRVILNKLCFANGVAVSPDQSFVLVVETGRYRVHRIWLSGPKKGMSEIFANNLPGFPDGISSNGKDKYWIALVTPRDAALDKLLPHPFLRKIIARLPQLLQPAPKRYGFVLSVNGEGEVVDNLQDGSKSCFAEIANVVEHNGFLYFGSIGEQAVGRFKLER